MKLVGFDSGLATFGAAKLVLSSEAGLPHHFEEIKVWTTKKSEKARRIRKADDIGDRMRYLSRQLLDFCDDKAVVAICVEATATPFVKMQTSVISALGRARGLVDVVAELRGLPIIEETAQNLKFLISGDRSASKNAMTGAVLDRFPELLAMLPPQRTLQEHAIDAAATAIVGLQTDVVRTVLRMAGAA